MKRKMKEIEEGCDNRRPTSWTDQCNRTGADYLGLLYSNDSLNIWLTACGNDMWSVMCCCIFVICIGLARAWVHQLSYWCHGKSMTTDIRLYPHVTQMRSSWETCWKVSWANCYCVVWAVHTFRISSCLICSFMLSFILPHAAPNPNDFFTLEH